jgi:addiction module RelE/StbE family toxin
MYTIFGMWVIYEHKRVSRSLSKAPIDVLKKYEKWKDIVSISGPQGLRAIKGFNDESLSGKWKGYRSSRLNTQYRVIYKAEKERVLVQVENITPHDYGRK